MTYCAALLTDPYTKCGLTKVVCISNVADFLVHHTPNKYIGRLGLDAVRFQQQLDALLDIEQGRRSAAVFAKHTLSSASLILEKTITNGFVATL